MSNRYSRKKIATFGLLYALLLGLSACGQRGALLPPTQNTNARTDINAPGYAASEKKAEENRNIGTPTKAPDKKFILDPLL